MSRHPCHGNGAGYANHNPRVTNHNPRGTVTANRPPLSRRFQFLINFQRQWSHNVEFLCIDCGAGAELPRAGPHLRPSLFVSRRVFLRLCAPRSAWRSAVDHISNTAQAHYTVLLRGGRQATDTPRCQQGRNSVRRAVAPSVSTRALLLYETYGTTKKTARQGPHSGPAAATLYAL